MLLEIELALEGFVDGLNDLPQRFEQRCAGPFRLALAGWPQQPNALLDQLMFEVPAEVVLVADQRLSGPVGDKVRLCREQIQQGCALNFTGLAARWTKRLGTPVSVALGMALLSGGLSAVAVLSSGGYGGALLGLVLMGAGCAIANPAMAYAIMSAIPPEKAGVGAGINGTLAEFGNGLGVAVLGAVLNSRFAALVPVAVGSASLPAALAAADGSEERRRITDAFASGVEASQLVGAVAVLAGGLLAAVLLHRAERADSR